LATFHQPVRSQQNRQNLRDHRDRHTAVVNIAGIAWLAGRFDQRMANAEAAIAKLEAKAEKDASQDVKIAVISEQLATISAGVGEIKAKLETRR